MHNLEEVSTNVLLAELRKRRVDLADLQLADFDQMLTEIQSRVNLFVCCYEPVIPERSPFSKKFMYKGSLDALITSLRILELHILAERGMLPIDCSCEPNTAGPEIGEHSDDDDCESDPDDLT